MNRQKNGVIDVFRAVLGHHSQVVSGQFVNARVYAVGEQAVAMRLRHGLKPVPEVKILGPQLRLLGL